MIGLPGVQDHLKLSPAFLWARLGARWIRWSGPRGVSLALEGPRLRSELGKFGRRFLCPETLWHAPCRECRQHSGCAWLELFPGSGGEEGRLAPWIGHFRQGEFYTLLASPGADALKGFWLALEAALASPLGLGRGSGAGGPAWLKAELWDAAADASLGEFPYGTQDLPMGPPPRPLREGDELSFEVPLQLRSGKPSEPPTMADWLRLGRNRLAALAAQNGRPIWPRLDPRWKILSELAEEARWTWLQAAPVSSWKPVPRHRFDLQGWQGQVRIERLPKAWEGWSALLPLIGVGTHIPFGCGTAVVSLTHSQASGTQPCVDVAADRTQRIIPLRWKANLA
jgi:hypothetical protein